MTHTVSEGVVRTEVGGENDVECGNSACLVCAKEDPNAQHEHKTQEAQEAQEALDNLDMRDVAPSNASDTCSVLFELFDVQFHDPGDALRMQQFASLLTVLTCVWLTSGSVSFFSSMHIGSPSQIDVVVNSSDLAAIDVVSAVVVMSGFVATYVHNSMQVKEFRELARLIWLLIMIDLWLASVVCLIFGTLFHLIQHTFHAVDLAITALEGLSGWRVFEWHQGRDAWHPYNLCAWPVMCVIWALQLLPITITGNVWLVKRFHHVGHLLIIVNACVPLVVITVFALLRDDTNIFFANASSFGYRMLEFNFGACLFHFMHEQSEVLTRVLFVLNRSASSIVLVFVLLWLSQIGSDATASSDTCIRMYYFARCIRVHHALLMRGCVLGTTAISCVVVPNSVAIPAVPLSVVPVLVSAIIFCWPLCYVLFFVLQINFTSSLMRENISLIVFVTPVVTLCVAYLWNQTFKIRCFQITESFFQQLLSILKTHGAKCSSAPAANCRR